ncbi:hypothetical protein, partial [Intestinibacter sp.]|uniref:hypothetical protein n=1 Tax=Intestinibacter sp. TaxID=1965304 RepID=UPI003F172018
TEADGKITAVNVTESDIASATLLGTKTDASTVDSAFGRIAKEVADRKAAIEALNTTVNSTGGTHVGVEVVETKGIITGVTVSENDIASANSLTSEVTRAKAAEDKIEASVGLAADGSHIKTLGNYTSSATTIAGEISALDNQVKKNADAIGTIENYTVNGKKISTSPTLGGADIALTGYTPDTNGDIFAAEDTVNEAMKTIMQHLVWYEA